MRYLDLDAMESDCRGLLLDAYGVFWWSNALGPYLGAKEAMQGFINRGKIVGILSNSTQLASDEVKKLNRYGLEKGVHFHFLVTSGEVARHTFLHEALTFATPRKTFYLFGGAAHPMSSHEAIFWQTAYRQVTEMREADFVYLSTPHLHGQDQTDPEVFREELAQVIALGLPIVCANPDRFAMEGNPARAVVRAGSLAAMYEKMGGSAVLYIGKPYQSVYAAAMRHFHQFNLMSPQEVLMVGDTPETDIRGARLFGMMSALVTHTGITAERASHEGLDAILQRLPPGDQPDYFIERLAALGG